MKLNHLDLQAPDVPALTRFFVDHFAFQPLTRLDSPKLAVLTDGHGFTLVIQRCGEAERYPDGFHVGFLVDGPAEVSARHTALAAAGVRVSGVSRDGRGTRCYCYGPAHLLIEIGCNTGSRVAVP